MPRKNKRASQGPSRAYLISYGDTMTALLAFFIVLNSLANEQTGANLYTGTGSFVHALNTFGLSGMFTRQSSLPAEPLRHRNPNYLADDSKEDRAERNPTGPDEKENSLRVIDRAAEEFERFLIEIEERFPVESLPESGGEIVFDLFNPLNSEPPVLTRAHRDLFVQVSPLLRDEAYHVDVAVWATTPSPDAWQRAAEKAAQVVEEVGQIGRLSPQQRARLRPYGKPWFDPKAERPVLSVIVRKVDRP